MMRFLRLAAPAIVLTAWLSGSSAQQGTPPAGTPPAGTPPAGTPPAPRPPAGTPPAAPDEAEEAQAPSDDAAEEVFIPTEELQPDAAVTFPVDI